ncbi:MAG TPA: alpha-E domain-containing protein, partial [Hymenobacter sp.]
SLLFTGTVKNTMPRDEGYAYINLGKFLERAIQTADILRIKWSGVSHDTQQTMETPELRYLLYSLFGYEQYVKTYKGKFSPDNVLQMILYNTNFPHSLLYSLNQLSRYFERLKEGSSSESYEQVEFLIGKTKNTLKYSHFTNENPGELNKFLLQIKNELFEIAAAFSKYYFGNS